MEQQVLAVLPWSIVQCNDAIPLTRELTYSQSLLDSDRFMCMNRYSHECIPQKHLHPSLTLLLANNAAIPLKASITVLVEQVYEHLLLNTCRDKDKLVSYPHLTISDNTAAIGRPLSLKFYKTSFRVVYMKHTVIPPGNRSTLYSYTQTLRSLRKQRPQDLSSYNNNVGWIIHAYSNLRSSHTHDPHHSLGEAAPASPKRPYRCRQA
jgi:hypothetical protein